MKHVFIINPTAGKKDCTTRMIEMAKGLAACHNLDVDCILTKRSGHAMETAQALADLIPADELRDDYIIPQAFDPRVGPAVAKAVADAARKSGVARL